MNLVLVEFCADWADEFDVHGMAIMTPEQFDFCKQMAKNTTWNFGSNEGWEQEDLSDGFHVVSINMPFIKQLDSVLNFYGDIVVNRRDPETETTWSSYKTWGTFPDFYEMAFEVGLLDE
jgi:hypothetical protein